MQTGSYFCNLPRGISIFAVSTYNTDYILIKKENYKKALEALEAFGYSVVDWQKIHMRNSHIFKRLIQIEPNKYHTLRQCSFIEAGNGERLNLLSIIYFLSQRRNYREGSIHRLTNYCNLFKIKPQKIIWASDNIKRKMQKKRLHNRNKWWAANN